MKGRRKKTKYSMVFATMVAMLSVCTAGVSTFAWFQASSEVRVSASSSSTTITVADPNESAKTALYVWKGNTAGGGSGEDDSHRKAIAGAATPSYATKEFPDAFTNLRAYNTSTSSAAFYTATSSFLPTQSINFAIVVDGTEARARKLQITGISSPVAATGSRHLYSGGTTTTDIVLAKAIKIYAAVIPGTATVSAGSISDFSSSLSGTLEDGSSGIVRTEVAIGRFLAGYSITARSSTETALTNRFSYNLASPASTYDLVTDAPSSQDALFLYSIQFSNTSDTHYQRVDSSGSAQYVSPDFSLNQETFWEAGGTSSEVYQGLKFNITSLLIM